MTAVGPYQLRISEDAARAGGWPKVSPVRVTDQGHLTRMNDHAMVSGRRAERSQEPEQVHDAAVGYWMRDRGECEFLGAIVLPVRRRPR